MPSSRLWVGVAWALLTIGIWAGWIVVTRLGVTTGLTVLDITALRFSVAGLVVLGVFVRQFSVLRTVSPGATLLMIIGGGAPYVLVAATGLRFAPASHAAALIPGVMPLFVALLAVGFLGERLSRGRWLGLGLILAGVAFFLGTSVGDEDSHEVWGHLLFLLASFQWAGFTVIMRRTGLAPGQATALVGVGSLAGVLPVYFALGTPSHLLSVGPAALFQLFYQGIITSVVSLLAYARAVRILGPARAAAFASLVPALATLLAIPVLGEWPHPADWVGIVLVSVGVYLATGMNVKRLQPNTPCRNHAKDAGGRRKAPEARERPARNSQ